MSVECRISEREKINLIHCLEKSKTKWRRMVEERNKMADRFNSAFTRILNSNFNV